MDGMHNNGGTHKKSYMVRSEESILLNKIYTIGNTIHYTIGNITI